MIGETFRCSWRVRGEDTHSGVAESAKRAEGEALSSPSPSTTPSPISTTVHFIAEQVSHYPAGWFSFFVSLALSIHTTYTYLFRIHLHSIVTAIFVECRDKSMQLSGTIHTRSKYLGMSVSVEFAGECKLKTKASILSFEF